MADEETGGPLLYSKKLSEWLRSYGVPARTHVPLLAELQPVVLVDDVSAFATPSLGKQVGLHAFLAPDGTLNNSATLEIEARAGGIWIHGIINGNSTWRIQTLVGTGLIAPTALTGFLAPMGVPESAIRLGHTVFAGLSATTPLCGPSSVWPLGKSIFVPPGITIRFYTSATNGQLLINSLVFEELLPTAAR